MRPLLLLALLVTPLRADSVPGSLRLVEGRFGKALDAQATPVVVDGSERFRKPPLTVECWAKLKSKTGFNVLVACDTKKSGQHWEVYSYAGSGAFSVYLPGMMPSEIVSKVDICDGKWHYLAVTHDGKQVRLFVDGKLAHEQAVQPRPGARPEAGPLTIGMALAALREKIGCDGLIDDVRISSTIRKIEGMPAGPLALDIPTVGLWRFDLAEAEDVDPAWTPRPAEGDAPPWEKATDKDWVDARFQQMDTGPFLNATFSYPGLRGKETVFKGTAVRVGNRGEAAVLYDRNQLRFAAGWPGWLNHSSRRFALLNTPTPTTPLIALTQSGAGWASAEGKWDNPHPATAPLPASWGKYRGLYLHGQRTVLSFSVHGVSMLESPWAETRDRITSLTRTLLIDPHDQPLHLYLLDAPGQKGVVELPGDARVQCLVHGARATAVGVAGDAVELHCEPAGKMSLKLPPSKKPTRVKLLLWTGDREDLPLFEKAVRNTAAPEDLAGWTKGGPTRWKPLTTRGEVGKDDGPLAIDTLTIPYDNPSRALFFCGGVDFLPGGEVVLCTAHGDVWVVSGVDDKLEKLTWKRFATGLYQPLGLKVIDGKVVVIERGQLTRLHDLNGDGEADLYENLNSDWHCAGGEHSFDTCLETDAEGNFYFFKTGDTQTPTGGCLLKVSKDGSKAEVFATGFRHPIGLGMSPSGILTGADQEGNWMPATRIDLYRRGGFYGDMRAHHRMTPPTRYDEPLCWLPRQLDNSAGGQVWVPEGKWGPLAGQMLHLSYGKCRMLLVLRQQVGEVAQAGAVDLGLQFLSGVARGRFHPRDGHLYLVGLNGWQSAAKKEGCLQRVRYTGKKFLVPVGLAVHENGVKLSFADRLDPQKAVDPKRYLVEQWSYRWSADYGSQRWSVARPNQVGQDRVPVKGVKLLPDGRSVFLELEDVRPVMQMQIRYGLSTADGEPLAGLVNNTIHRPAPREK